MRLRPLGRNVLIKLTNEETTTESGIIIKEKQQGNVGTVVEMAKEDENLKIGDRVFFKPHGHDVIKNGTDTYIMTSIDNILAIEVE